MNGSAECLKSQRKEKFKSHKYILLNYELINFFSLLPLAQCLRAVVFRRRPVEEIGFKFGDYNTNIRYIYRSHKFQTIFFLVTQLPWPLSPGHI